MCWSTKSYHFKNVQLQPSAWAHQEHSGACNRLAVPVRQGWHTTVHAWEGLAFSVWINRLFKTTIFVTGVCRAQCCNSLSEKWDNDSKCISLRQDKTVFHITIMFISLTKKKSFPFVAGDTAFASHPRAFFFLNKPLVKLPNDTFGFCCNSINRIMGSILSSKTFYN